MTSDLPPLSKTHPTLWNHPIHQHTMDDLIGLNDRSLWECLQSCTVDKAEHEGVKRLYCHYMAEVERLKAEHDTMEEKLCARITCLLAEKTLLQDDVERLKKELLEFQVESLQEELDYEEEIKSLKKELESAWATINDIEPRLERAVGEHEKLYAKGFAEGERRAMQQVKEAINKHVQWLEDNALLGNPDLQRSALYLIVGLSNKDDEHTPGDNNCLCQQCVKDDEVRP